MTGSCPPVLDFLQKVFKYLFAIHRKVWFSFIKKGNAIEIFSGNLQAFEVQTSPTNLLPVFSNLDQGLLVDAWCSDRWRLRWGNSFSNVRILGCLPSRTNAYRLPIYDAIDPIGCGMHDGIAIGELPTVEDINLLAHIRRWRENLRD